MVSVITMALRLEILDRAKNKPTAEHEDVSLLSNSVRNSERLLRLPALATVAPRRRWRFSASCSTCS